MKLRKPTAYWDRFQVPEASTAEEVNALLNSRRPKDSDFDYALYTDGSGHKDGYGANAAIIQPLCPLPTGSDNLLTSVNANYGSNVLRNEFEAMLNGITTIAQFEVERRHKLGLNDTSEAQDGSQLVGKEKLLKTLTGESRIRVLWFTDRMTLAHSFVRSDMGGTYLKQTRERDLYARWRFFRPYVALWPIYTPRNEIHLQGLADSLCSKGRSLVRDLMQAVCKNNDHFWLNKPIQKSYF